MTIKEIDCAGCGGTGFFLRASTKILSWHPPSLEAYIENDFEIEKCFCGCVHGEIEQILQHQRSHPEYVNPLGHLSHAQIIEVLNQAAGDQSAINAEFNLNKDRWHTKK